MFKKLKSVFETKIETESDTFSTLQIAISCLMIQTAVHDGKFDEAEKNKILELLKGYFKLDNEEIDKLFIIAMKANDDSNDIHQFTMLLNKTLSEDEKLKIIEMMWQIILADHHIDDYENNLIRRISGLLYLNDQDVGNIKKQLID